MLIMNYRPFRSVPRQFLEYDGVFCAANNVRVADAIIFLLLLP